MAPSISVLMPVYNAERYVSEALGSILNQTYHNFEFLIIDDGSTDRSLAILQDYAGADNRIHLTSRPNTGYVVALNEMLRLARGQFIARMDSDDRAEAHRFRRQLEFLETHPAHVAVGSRVLLIDPDGCPIREFREAMTHEEVDHAHMHNCSGAVICHPTAMMRRQAVIEVGGYRPEAEPAEDVDLFLRLAEIGKLEVLSDVLLQYRLHFDSVSLSRRREQLEKIQRAAIEARQRRGLPPLQLGDSAAVPAPSMTSERSDTRHRLWAWWALGAHNNATARKHALKAVAKNPFSWSNAKCLLCTLRGY